MGRLALTASVSDAASHAGVHLLASLRWIALLSFLSGLPTLCELRWCAAGADLARPRLLVSRLPALPRLPVLSRLPGLASLARLFRPLAAWRRRCSPAPTRQLPGDVGDHWPHLLRACPAGRTGITGPGRHYGAGYK